MAPEMSNPLTDESGFTLRGSRFETPSFIVELMRQLMRDTYGDKIADAMEATIPPPYGTLQL